MSQFETMIQMALDGSFDKFLDYVQDNSEDASAAEDYASPTYTVLRQLLSEGEVEIVVWSEERLSRNEKPWSWEDGLDSHYDKWWLETLRLHIRGTDFSFRVEFGIMPDGDLNFCHYVASH
jgi:hypothetical protein